MQFICDIITSLLASLLVPLCFTCLIYYLLLCPTVLITGFCMCVCVCVYCLPSGLKAAHNSGLHVWLPLSCCQALFLTVCTIALFFVPLYSFSFLFLLCFYECLFIHLSSTLSSFLTFSKNFSPLIIYLFVHFYFYFFFCMLIMTNVHDDAHLFSS